MIIKDMKKKLIKNEVNEDKIHTIQNNYINNNNTIQ